MLKDRLRMAGDLFRWPRCPCRERLPAAPHDLAAALVTPALSWRREFAAAGGLTSYGTSFDGPPSGLPVERWTKVELFINLKTAKALGLTIS